MGGRREAGGVEEEGEGARYLLPVGDESGEEGGGAGREIVDAEQSLCTTESGLVFCKTERAACALTYI